MDYHSNPKTRNMYFDKDQLAPKKVPKNKAAQQISTFEVSKQLKDVLGFTPSSDNNTDEITVMNIELMTSK